MKLPDFFPHWNCSGFILDATPIKRFCNGFVLTMILGAAALAVYGLVRLIRG